MSDILTTWDPWLLTGDWMFDGSDLLNGSDLETATILSLFSDRLAEEDDPLPDPSDGDRRGWWADYNAGLVYPGTGPIGSRLWLISREKSTEDTRLRAEAYCREALQWMLDDDVADEVAVNASWVGAIADRLDVSVIISRDGRELLNRAYSWAWAQRPN